MAQDRKEKKTLKATHGSDKTPLKLGGIEIPCYVLENGQRVFSGKGMQDALGFDKKASGMALKLFFNMERFNKLVTPEILEKFSERIEFKRPGSGGAVETTYGYEATLLVDLCDIIIQAKNDGLLTTENQLKIAQQAEIIIRSVAKVGIIALVDEATGYQKQKNEYQKLLQLYIAKELQPYLATFDENYYKQLYRLQGWDWDAFKNKKKNHPQYIGKLTNRLVYEKLPSGVLEELQKLNPKNEKGNRKNKHFQFLTTNIGYRELIKHLAAITILMEQFPDGALTEAISKIDARFPSHTPFYQTSMDFPVADKGIFDEAVKRASLSSGLKEEIKS